MNSNKVFREVNGKIFIGEEEIKPELRAILKEQAIYLSTSQIFEIIVNTIKQESVRMALSDSLEWNHVLSAKMLKYWGDTFVSIILKLQQ